MIPDYPTKGTCPITGKPSKDLFLCHFPEGKRVSTPSEFYKDMNARFNKAK